MAKINGQQIATLSQMLDKRLWDIKSKNAHSSVLFARSSNAKFIELLMLCPQIRLGRNYISQAYPKLAILKERIDLCTKKVHQVTPAGLIENQNAFIVQLRALVRDKPDSLSAFIEQEYHSSPNYVKQQIRLQLLAFMSTHQLLNSAEDKTLNNIYQAPLSHTALADCKQLLDKKAQQLITTPGGDHG